MTPDAFTLADLKSIFDEVAINTKADAASYFTTSTRVQMESLTMTLNLVRNSDETFGFAGADSVNLVHARYAHHSTAGSDLHIGLPELGKDDG